MIRFSCDSNLPRKQRKRSMESAPRNLRVWDSPWLGTFSPCSRRGRTHGSEYKRSAREEPWSAGARAPGLDAWFPPLSRVTCAPFSFPYWPGRLGNPVFCLEAAGCLRACGRAVLRIGQSRRGSGVVGE